MRQSDVHELLAQLYLRLNGYFTTGLILHSPEWGQARTEVDCLAVRHPYHVQSERGVGVSDLLGGSEDTTELILCEVKSDVNRLEFNRPLREDAEALQAMLRWVGLFNDEQARSVAEKLRPLLDERTLLTDARAGVMEGSVRLRALLCCPPITEAPETKWCLTGPEIFRFADQCFNPAKRRETCSTRYNFDQWGYPFTPIIRYIKNREAEGDIRLEDLYRHLGAA